jgi:exonuclease SbcC
MIIRVVNMKNFLSHGDSSIPLEGIRLGAISGPNGHGKISIIDAILWSLFGEARVRSASDLVKLGQTEMSVELSFNLGDTTYRVQRSWTAKGGGKSNLAFESISPAGGVTLLNGSSIRETEEKIRQVLRMDHNTLVNSAFLLQGEADQFSKADPAKRKEVLSTILGLDLYSQCADQVREEGRDLKRSVEERQTVLRAKEARLGERQSVVDARAYAQNLVSACKEEITGLEETLTGLRAQAEGLSVDEARLGSLVSMRSGKQSDLQAVTLDLSSIKSRLLGLTTNQRNRVEYELRVQELGQAEKELQGLQEAARKVSDLTAQFHQAESEANVLNNERQRQHESAKRTYETLEMNLHNEQAQVDTEILRLEQLTKPLESLPCAGNEMQSECRLLAAANEANAHIPRLRDQLLNIKGRITELPDGDEYRAVVLASETLGAPNPHLGRAHDLKAQILGMDFDANREKSLKETVSRLAGYPDMLKKLDIEATQIEDLKTRQAKSEAQSTSIEDQIANLGHEINCLDEKVSALPNLRFRIGQNQTALETSRKELSDAERSLATAEEQLRQLDSLSQEIEAMKKELADSDKQLVLLTDLANMFGKNGIQAMLIERSLPLLEDEANLILNRISEGLSISLETQSANKTGGMRETLDIVIADDQGQRSYENYSGGERFRVDFALRIALSKLLAHRAGARIETLVIDEGFGSQDAEGLQKLIECLQAITDEFKCILVISHIEDMKDAFLSRITVTKGPDGSHVEVAA